MQDLPKISYSDIDKARIQVDAGDILKLLGDQQGMIGAHTEKLVDKYITECLRISSPAGALVLTEALDSSSPEDIHIEGVRFNSGKIIPKMLRNSQNYAFFLVTAGPEPETLARSLMTEGNYLDGYIMDLLASALVDSAADLIQEQVRNLAEQKSMRITNRYSPGYCSWNVDEQQKLFKLFPESCCGISLSESSLMNPVKSISGIIGMGAEVAFRDYTCEICSMLHCQFRKVENQ